jgi:hypothetical protein
MSGTTGHYPSQPSNVFELGRPTELGAERHGVANTPSVRRAVAGSRQTGIDAADIPSAVDRHRPRCRSRRRPS